MKTILTIGLSIFLISGLYAQDSQKDSQKKNEKKEKLSASYKNISAYVDSMGFVVEADVLRDQYGNRVNVSSGINFIEVDSTHAVLQTGNNFSMGANGVGGVTAEGNITNWKVNKNDKKESISIQMDVMTNIGMYTVFFDISSSGFSTATLSGLWPGKLIWEGRFIPITQARNFKGRTSY